MAASRQVVRLSLEANEPGLTSQIFQGYEKLFALADRAAQVIVAVQDQQGCAHILHILYWRHLHVAFQGADLESVGWRADTQKMCEELVAPGLVMPVEFAISGDRDQLGRAAVRAGGGVGAAREHQQWAGVPGADEAAGAARGGVRGQRRSRGIEERDSEGVAGSDLAALLRALFAQRAGLLAAKSQ